jgi:hypothetical protein
LPPHARKHAIAIHRVRIVLDATSATAWLTIDRMRRLLVLACLLALGCNEKKEETAAEPAEPKPESLDATTFCELVLGAPKRHLEASCTDDEKKQPAFGYLASVADQRIAECKRWIEPDAPRLFLSAQKARACAAVLEKASWKETLLGAPVARWKECATLVRGIEKAGASCRLDAKCAEGLACAGATAEADGKCEERKAFGSCTTGAGLRWIDGFNDACQAEHACAGTNAHRIHPLGYDGPPEHAIDPSREITPGLTGNRYGVRGPGDDNDPHVARQRALEEAARFGLIGTMGGEGLMHAGGPRGLDCVIRAVPIELGDLAPGRGLGTGFGSGGGRLGGGERGKAPPKVRMGGTNVTGRLPPEVIQRIVRQNFGRFRLCYENGLRNNPGLAGRVTVRFVIGTDGGVSTVSGSGDLPDSGVVSCVTRAFYGLNFPQPEGGIVTVSYPIVFSPSDDPPPSPGASASASASAEASAEPPPPPPPAPPAVMPDVPSAAAEGTCESNPPLEAGKCRTSADCGAGERCRREGIDWLCQKRLADGESCTHSVECAGICGADGKCASFCDGR